MKQSEFKRHNDPEMGWYVKKHIYGEGISDVFKLIAKKVFEQTAKEATKTVTKKAVQTAATKSGEFVGKKTGDKIIQLLSKRNNNTTTPLTPKIKNPQTRELCDYEMNERVNQLLSGGRMRNHANHAVNIKNLLEYSPVYAESIATNEVYFLDTSIEEEDRKFTADATYHIAKRRAVYNKDFALRKALQGTSSTVNTKISLKRYSFFEMLEDELLPYTRVELNLEIESDGDLIWQAGAFSRGIITRM